MIFEFFFRLLLPLNKWWSIRLKETERRQLQKALKHAPLYFVLGKDWQIKGPQYISLGKGFYGGGNLRIEAIESHNGQMYHPEMVFGDGVAVGDFCHFACAESMKIGNNTLMGSKVFITDHYHGRISHNELALPPAARPLYSKPVEIGENVWIGDSVSIMPGVTIGDNVIIGANSVVTHSFPANSVIAGCPAKIIRSLE